MTNKDDIVILPFPRRERSPPKDPHFLTSKALAARWQYEHVESVYRIPASELPYYAWWLGVQEGRFTPGDTLAFDWEGELVDVGKRTAEEGQGGFVSWYSTSDTDSANAKALQKNAFQ